MLKFVCACVVALVALPLLWALKIPCHTLAYLFGDDRLPGEEGEG